MKHIHAMFTPLFVLARATTVTAGWNMSEKERKALNDKLENHYLI